MKDIKKIAKRLARFTYENLDYFDAWADAHTESLFESILREELEGESVTKIDQTCDKPSPLAEAIVKKIHFTYQEAEDLALVNVQQVIDNHFKDVEVEAKKYLEFIDQCDFRTNSGYQLSIIIKDFLHHMINKEV